MAALELDNLIKTYGAVRANDGLTLDVEAGEIFGSLGPNGVDETTTIRLVLGVVVLVGVALVGDSLSVVNLVAVHLLSVPDPLDCAGRRDARALMTSQFVFVRRDL